jgi:CHAT domain-containing protein
MTSPYEKESKKIGRRLDELVMAPIRQSLGETGTLFISPDGQLNLVPFAALVDEKGKYLVERYAFTYLGSGRDLLRLQVPAASREGPRLVANADYDGSITTDQPEGLSKEDRLPTQFGLRFGPLPGAAQEAETRPHGS